MHTIDFTAFMNFCRGLQGQTLSTVGGRAHFVLSSVENDRLNYKVSTGKPRSAGKPYIEAVLRHYTLTDSLHPHDYKHVTMNASYTLALLKQYVNH